MRPSKSRPARYCGPLRPAVHRAAAAIGSTNEFRLRSTNHRLVSAECQQLQTAVRFGTIEPIPFAARNENRLQKLAQHFVGD
jgi:hypothetical protein